MNKVDYLNLFINCLVNEESGPELDFMRPLDKENEIRKNHLIFMKETIEGAKSDTSGKINTVCDALKEELLKINVKNFYLLPILTIYTKK